MILTKPGNRPQVEIIEEGMREGMQIESVDISVADKVRLIDLLSRTGLSTIVVGSFVSPRWTPQMRDVEDVIRGFTPVPGVRYTALALNRRGTQRMADFMPPLSAPEQIPTTMLNMCDVFARRNTNRSQADEIVAMAARVAQARDLGATAAGIGIASAFGSNWLGDFELAEHLDLLDRQWTCWHEAGIAVTRVQIADSMGWNTPMRTEEVVRAVCDRWPGITTVHLHLHDARGCALTSAYAALGCLDDRHRLVIDSAIGGMGGCPYCGHGRFTRMIPTEDLVDLLHELAIPTGVDLDRLIEVVHEAERIVGHELWGHVSQAGPRPRGERLFPMDLPLVETAEEAQHFRLGAGAVSASRSPWTRPIVSAQRQRLGLRQDGGS